MTYSLTWLADVLRAEGLKVVEQPGWQSRGRKEISVVKGVLCHHTAGARTGNAPSLGLVQNGRPDLPGPLSHLVLGRDGTFFVVAAGRCNHAGAGSWQGVWAGNAHFIGIEAENAGDGKDPWPDVQMATYAQGVAAILKHVGVPAIMCVGHKEYATPRGRKIDPAFDMVAFRTHVDNFMGVGASTSLRAMPVEPSDPYRDMLRRGDSGEDVRILQSKLRVPIDGDFGPATERAVKIFQGANGLLADGLVGPNTWQVLGL